MSAERKRVFLGTAMVKAKVCPSQVGLDSDRLKRPVSESPEGRQTKRPAYYTGTREGRIAEWMWMSKSLRCRHDEMEKCPSIVTV